MVSRLSSSRRSLIQVRLSCGRGSGDVAGLRRRGVRLLGRVERHMNLKLLRFVSRQGVNSSSKDSFLGVVLIAEHAIEAVTSVRHVQMLLQRAAMARACQGQVVADRLYLRLGNLLDLLGALGTFHVALVATRSSLMLIGILGSRRVM